MILLKFRDRTECTDSGPVMLELQGNQADKKMCFDKIGLGTQQPLAALRRLIQSPRG
jgi:hypothetical protein